jgi:hypothetical protein
MKTPAEYARNVLTHVNGGDFQRIATIISAAMSDAMDYAWQEWCTRARVPAGDAPPGLRLEDVIRAGFRELSTDIANAFKEVLQQTVGKTPTAPGRLATLKAAAPEFGMSPDAFRKWLLKAHLPSSVFMRLGKRALRVDVAKLRAWVQDSSPK